VALLCANRISLRRTAFRPSFGVLSAKLSFSCRRGVARRLHHEEAHRL